MTKWSEENTEQNARHLCTVLWLWSACSRSDQETEGSPGPAVAYIGWVEEKVWHGNRDAIPILHPHQGIPAVYPPEYFLSAFRQCDDKRERIVGTQYRGYTRWRTDISPGQTIHLQMMSCSFCTDRMSDSFHASTSPLSRDFGVEVDSLRLVSRVTFSVLTSITLLEGCSTTVYYFAHPPKPDGSLPDPPGFWSYSPEPLADASLEAGSAEVNFSNVTSNVRYHKLDPAVHHLLQDFESQGFLLVSEINRAFGLPFCTTRPVPERQETSFNQSLRHRLRTNRVSARFKYKKRDKLSL
ncbi:hypothetical protein SISSUDRAFT_1048885 [Sistotremastrum suecicum HHB10207 ss-3]|uniref:Uncharacterized protein n=1 Tax=Sistotremastrum suecicum HHB10207 ss-3 TaxID=1314776 RepID=A0A166C6S5_9AGAM|nr:hypothetical protein SISSUDRAFT_1048885 [Sistotremastrum suecicum HHB10207 ss-3]